MSRLVLSVLVAVLISFSATADESANKQAIEKLFSVMGIDKQLTSGFEAMLPIVDDLARRLQLEPEQKEVLKNIYREWWDQDIDREKIKADMMDLYANTFNVEDIEAITAFYESPTGQKFLRLSPELMQLSAQMGMDEARSKEQLLIQRLEPFMEQHAK